MTIKQDIPGRDVCGCTGRAAGGPSPQDSSLDRIAMKAIASQVLLLLPMAWIVWSADLWTALSLLLPAYLVVGSISLGILLLPAFFLLRRRSALVVPGAWLAFLFVLPFVPNSSLKPLMWGVQDLVPGMDRGTVVATLHSHYPGTGFPDPVVYSEEPGDGWGRPSATRMCLKPQGRSPMLQAESLMLFFEEGRFERAQFLAD